MDVKIEESWRRVLGEEFDKEYFVKLAEFVKSEYKNSTVYPSAKFIFRAFEMTPFNKVKVVILGQDPYHGQNQANGLCFTVDQGVAQPPSLQNIYKEIFSDIGKQGDINKWPEQGVFLLNSTLTVRASSPGSHQNKGWEEFTDTVINKLSEEKENLVFILWGKYAQDKALSTAQGEDIINKNKHFIIKSPHPSPFSAYSGFFGSKPFSKCNQYLKKKGIKEIEW